MNNFKKNNRSKFFASDKFALFILLTPALIFCSVFIFIPSINAIFGSFFSFGFDNLFNWKWVGFDNYIKASKDEFFWIALKNNLIIVFASIILQVGVGTILAAILDRGIPYGKVIFRTIIFTPMVISSVAVGLIWLIIYEPNIGILNAIIKSIGLNPPTRGWLGDPNISIWMVMIAAAWQYTGFMMVLILAGLQGISTEVYDAAEIDGATGVKAFWYITLPMLRNVLLVAILITTIGAFKVFEFIFVMTNGGPSNSTQVLGTYIYLQAFTLLKMGYANAISVVLLIIALILGWMQLKASRRA
jgi:raffinose/stachyose/melibiose transport system permease protein